MPDPAPADPVAAYLTRARERFSMATYAAATESYNERRIAQDSASDVPRLLAAVEAVLALHQPGPIVVLGRLCKRHECHRYFSITSTEAADVAACTDCTATVYSSCTGCGTPLPLEGCPARVAISRALLGEEVSRG